MKTRAQWVNHFFRKRWVWSLCLVLLLSTFVWFVGPLLSIDEYRPWQSETARLLTACILLLAWGLYAVLDVGSASSIESEPTGDTENAQRTAIMDEERLVLQERFKDALKTSRTSGAGTRKPREDLPWYLVIGPEQSGKTNLLDMSGLEMPLVRGENQRLTRDTFGTRYADWYFTNNGVLIDTAGRYLTQSDATVDCNGWRWLLTLLKKRRGRALNGVLVTLSIDSLLSRNEFALETLARQVRQRLQEIHQKLRIEIPVYLVLTKGDLLIGFDEFFDQLSQEEAGQVLGTTFTEAQNGTDSHVIRQTFETLLQRLNAQVIGRLHSERDTQRRGRVLDFPGQLARIGVPLALFVELAFAGNRYQRGAQLRGYYVTSAPNLEDATSVATSNIDWMIGSVGHGLPVIRRGRARFIHDLLNRVIFPEADLASLDIAVHRRQEWKRRCIYGGALATVVAGGFIWANSFSTNHQRLEHLKDLAQTKAQQNLELRAHANGVTTLDVLDSSYAASQVYAPERANRWSRTGLYQGAEVDPVVHLAYRRDLEELLLPLIAGQLESEIQASHHDRERLLNNLRAYLMLKLADRRDDTFLKDWMATTWSTHYAGNAVVQHGLSSHLDRLLSHRFAPYSLNDTLIARARSGLRGESMANVVYRMIRDRAGYLPDYRLDQHMGAQAALFTSADHAIPGFYTLHGYQSMFATQGLSLVQDILQDNWVLGESDSLSPKDLSRLLTDVERLYFQDYADQWGEAIAALALQPIGDAQQGAMQLSGLTSANSPLIRLLAEIRENTRLPGAPEAAIPNGAIAQASSVAGGKAAKFAGAIADTAHHALSASSQPGSRRALEQRFQALHRLLDDEGSPTIDLVNVMQSLNALQIQMASLANAGMPDQAAFEMAKARMKGQRDAFDQLRLAVARLPQPVGGWLSLSGDDSWSVVLNGAHGYLNLRYQHELYATYKGSLKQRYPFSAHSESDVAVADFKEFFKAQGLAQSFIDTYLQPFVSNASGQYQLRRVDGRGLPLSRDFLRQLSRVQAIRAGFFAENANEPSIAFKLEPYSLDSNVGRADFRFGSSTMEYRHGPIVQTAFRWPAGTDEGRASLVVEALNGEKVGIEKNSGPWSLFRLIDLMKVDYHSGRDVLMLKANLGGLHANYLLHAQRAPSPFDIATLRNFDLPATL